MTDEIDFDIDDVGVPKGEGESFGELAERLRNEEVTYPAVLSTEALMKAPEGTQRVGDEFHNPDNWVDCPECPVDCPAESDTCFNCGADLDG